MYDVVYDGEQHGDCNQYVTPQADTLSELTSCDLWSQ